MRIATDLVLGLTARYEVRYQGGVSCGGGETTQREPVPLSIVAEFVPTSFNSHGHPIEAVISGSFFEPGQPVFVNTR